MAVLQKIRGWGIWLSLIIAFALLLFLVDPTVVSRLFGQGGIQKETYGYIAGEEVTNEEFYEITQKYNYSDRLEGYQSAWQQIVFKRLLDPWFEKAGIRVSESAVDDEIAAYPEEYVQYFGKDVLRQNLVNGMKVQAYANLFHETSFANDTYMERVHADVNGTATVDVLTLDAPTEGIEVTDDEISAAFNARKFGWAPRSSEVEVVNIHVYPSEADMAEATQKYAKNYEEFCTTENVGGFLRRNSDENSKNVRFYKKGELDGELDNLLFGQGQNQTEILSEGYDFKAARVLSSQPRSASGNVALYAFLETEKADSLLALLNGGRESIDSLRARHEVTFYGNFPITVNKPSADIPDAYGNPSPVDFGVEFLDQPVGKYAMKDRYGSRFVYALTDKEQPELMKEVAVYAKHVLPSNATYKAVSDSVKVFYANAMTLDKLPEAGMKFSGMSTVYDMTVLDTVTVYRTMEGQLGNMKAMTKSVFSHDKGSVIFSQNQNSNDLFLIGIKSFRQEGPARLDEVKESLRMELTLRKAAQARLAAVREEVKGESDFAAMAEKLGATADRKVLAYDDPRLVGAARALAAGEIGMIDGLNGQVYVFQVVENELKNSVDTDFLKESYWKESAARMEKGEPIQYILRLNDVTSYLDRLF